MANLGLEIQETLNGFIVMERATIRSILCGEVRTYIFKNAEELTVFIKEHFARPNPALNSIVGDAGHSAAIGG